MTTDRGGGMDEELFWALIADGVPRNYAILLSTIPGVRNLSASAIEVLEFMSTDPSGRTIINQFYQGMPIASGSSVEDVVGYLRSPEGNTFASQEIAVLDYADLWEVVYNGAEPTDEMNQWVLRPEGDVPSLIRRGQPALGFEEPSEEDYTRALERLGASLGLDDTSGVMPQIPDQAIARSFVGTAVSGPEFRVEQTAQERAFPFSKAGREGLTPEEAAFEGALGAETLKRRKPVPEKLTYQDYQGMGLAPVAGESKRVFESRMATAIGKGYKTAAELLPEDIERINRMRTRILAPSDEPQIPWQRDPANLKYWEEQKALEQELPFLAKRFPAAPPPPKPPPSTRKFRPPARWLVRR